MNFEDFDDDLDFIEIAGTKKRTISHLQIEPRSGQLPFGTNAVLDMRIIHSKIVTDRDNVAHIGLIFKLDYHPVAFIDTYTLFVTFYVDVFDRNRIIENNPTSDLCVAYMAHHYKENGERLFQELKKQAKEKFFRNLQGKFTITDQEAQEQTRIVLTNYFGEKKS